MQGITNVEFGNKLCGSEIKQKSSCSHHQIWRLQEGSSSQSSWSLVKSVKNILNTNMVHVTKLMMYRHWSVNRKMV